MKLSARSSKCCARINLLYPLFLERCKEDDRDRDRDREQGSTGSMSRVNLF
jgi:hypothetical protein